jgi:hypothetical protein
MSVVLGVIGLIHEICASCRHNFTVDVISLHRSGLDRNATTSSIGAISDLHWRVHRTAESKEVSELGWRRQGVHVVNIEIFEGGKVRVVKSPGYPGSMNTLSGKILKRLSYSKSPTRIPHTPDISALPNLRSGLARSCPNNPTNIY